MLEAPSLTSMRGAAHGRLKQMRTSLGSILAAEAPLRRPQRNTQLVSNTKHDGKRSRTTRRMRALGLAALAQFAGHLTTATGRSSLDQERTVSVVRRRAVRGYSPHHHCLRDRGAFAAGI